MVIIISPQWLNRMGYMLHSHSIFNNGVALKESVAMWGCHGNMSAMPHRTI
jgi:hypothetical protein